MQVTIEHTAEDLFIKHTHKSTSTVYNLATFCCLESCTKKSGTSNNEIILVLKTSFFKNSSNSKICTIRTVELHKI